MKLVLLAEQLGNALFIVSNIVNGKNENLSLRFLKINISDDKIMTMVGSDGEVELEATIGAVEVNEGEGGAIHIQVAAKQLQDIIKLIPKDQQVQLELIDNLLKITSGSDKYSLSCVGGSDIPGMKLLEDTDADDITEISISSDNLLNMMRKTTHAIAHQDIRQYLNGMLFECIKNTLRCVATDGHRMSIVSGKLSNEVCDEIRRFILVKRSVLELLRILAAFPDKIVTIRASSRTFVVSMDGWRFSTKLMNVTYPNYEQVIPPICNQFFSCSCADLDQAIKKTAIVGEKNRGLQLSISDGCLVCESSNLDSGETAHTTIAVESKIQEGISLVLNSKYVSDIISTIEGDTNLIFYCGANQQGILICPENNIANRYVIMPIKV